MKERILMMLAAMLMICGTTAGLMSCSNDDNPVINNEMSEKVLGTWYTEFDQAGVYGEGESAKPYAKAVLYGTFYEGNDGMFVCLFVDANGKAVDLGDTFLGAGCEYTVAPDGKVDIRLTGDSEAVTLSPKWSMTYRDGQLIGKVLNDVELRMSPITEAQRAQYQEWMRQLGLGNDTEPGEILGGNVLDLSTVEYGHYEAQNGDILMGQLNFDVDPGSAYCTIVIPNNATITLRDAIIGGEDFIRYAATAEIPAILCLGNATILLEGVNEVYGNYDGLPSIYVKPNCKLTIKASDNVPRGELPELKVYNGGREGTAIGGGPSDYRDCGDITIARCKLTANGDDFAPNIGCSGEASCGSIQFLDGCQVEAWCGWDNVAIGCGQNGSCFEVFISEGSTVIAHAGRNAPAIGASKGGTCYRIIAEGNVKAYRYWSTSETLPVSAWLNASAVFLNRRIDKDIHDYMIADGLTVDRDDILPAMKRNKNEFIIDYQ